MNFSKSIEKTLASFTKAADKLERISVAASASADKLRGAANELRIEADADENASRQAASVATKIRQLVA